MCPQGGHPMKLSVWWGRRPVIKDLSCNTTYMSRHCLPTHRNFSVAEETASPSGRGFFLNSENHEFGLNERNKPLHECKLIVSPCLSMSSNFKPEYIGFFSIPIRADITWTLEQPFQSALAWADRDATNLTEVRPSDADWIFPACHTGLIVSANMVVWGWRCF